MKSIAPALAALIVIAAAAAPARAQDPPPIIVAGLNAYRTSGPAAALATWFQGWSQEAAAQAKPQLLGVLEQIDAVAGRMNGYDLLGSAHWGPHAQRIYVVVLHEQRSAFYRFDVYLAAAGWRVLNVTVNIDPAQVFPPEFLLPGRHGSGAQGAVRPGAP